MARRHLPLPAAFREAAIALRAIARQNRKHGNDYRSALEELYRLAAILELLHSICRPASAARIQRASAGSFRRVRLYVANMGRAWPTKNCNFSQRRIAIGCAKFGVTRQCTPRLITSTVTSGMATRTS
jgi:hypothetical protein